MIGASAAADISPDQPLAVEDLACKRVILRKALSEAISRKGLFFLPKQRTRQPRLHQNRAPLGDGRGISWSRSSRIQSEPQLAIHSRAACGTWRRGATRASLRGRGSGTETVKPPPRLFPMILPAAAVSEANGEGEARAGCETRGSRRFFSRETRGAHHPEQSTAESTKEAPKQKMDSIRGGCEGFRAPGRWGTPSGGGGGQKL